MTEIGDAIEDLQKTGITILEITSDILKKKWLGPGRGNFKEVKKKVLNFNTALDMDEKKWNRLIKAKKLTDLVALVQNLVKKFDVVNQDETLKSIQEVTKLRILLVSRWNELLQLFEDSIRETFTEREIGNSLTWIERKVRENAA